MHRDIKFQNIMFANHDKNLVKLIDFGLAIHKDAQSEDESMVGTVNLNFKTIFNSFKF